METYVRAKRADAILDASHKVDHSLKGAAMAMGCQVVIETVPGNLPLRNDAVLSEVFKDNAGSLFGKEQYRDYGHGGGSTDAGDLSQIMPVLHPVMTGGSGTHHQTDWCISDHDAGYVAPAKTLAMMALDLLAGEGARAPDVLEQFQPAMSKQEYLDRQQAVFHTELFDGSK